MKATMRKGADYNINLSLTFDDARDIIKAINMAEGEGIGNRASILKEILENLLRKVEE